MNRNYMYVFIDGWIGKQVDGEIYNRRQEKRHNIDIIVNPKKKKNSIIIDNNIIIYIIQKNQRLESTYLQGYIMQLEKLLENGQH